jgi:hypothetical protein
MRQETQLREVFIVISKGHTKVDAGVYLLVVILLNNAALGRAQADRRRIKFGFIRDQEHIKNDLYCVYSQFINDWP